MKMFEVYTKEVQIKDSNGNVNTYKLRPLSGRFTKKLFDTIKATAPKNKLDESLTEEEQRIERLKQLDTQALQDLHELLVETFKKSYPNQELEQIDEFCTQNLMSLLEPLLEVNMGKDE
jgi:UDP-galactopyranose mutase